MPQCHICVDTILDIVNSAGKCQRINHLFCGLMIDEIDKEVQHRKITAINYVLNFC